MKFLQDLASSLHRAFNTEARDYKEVMDLRGNHGPEANERILEIIRSNIAKVYENPGDLYQNRNSAVVGMGCSALLDNGTEGIKRLEVFAKESSAPEDFLKMLNAEFNFPPEPRVRTPEVVAFAESLVADLKVECVSGLEDGSKDWSVADKNEKIALVQRVANIGLVSEDVNKDFKLSLNDAHMKAVEASREIENARIIDHS